MKVYLDGKFEETTISVLKVGSKKIEETISSEYIYIIKDQGGSIGIGVSPADAIEHLKITRAKHAVLDQEFDNNAY